MISHDQCNGLLGLNGTTLPPTGTTTMITKARRSVRQTQSARRRTRPRSSRGRVQSGEGGQAGPRSRLGEAGGCTCCSHVGWFMPRGIELLG
jgi:hypothetical protein